MKVRTGFVSNSSSSSFVIAKSFMTEEQIAKFKAWIEDPVFSADLQEAINDFVEGGEISDPLEYFEYGGHIEEQEHYFVGGNDQNFSHEAICYLESIGVKPEHVAEVEC